MGRVAGRSRPWHRRYPAPRRLGIDDRRGELTTVLAPAADAEVTHGGIDSPSARSWWQVRRMRMVFYAWRMRRTPCGGGLLPTVAFCALGTDFDAVRIAFALLAYCKLFNGPRETASAPPDDDPLWHSLQRHTSCRRAAPSTERATRASDAAAVTDASRARLSYALPSLRSGSVTGMGAPASYAPRSRRGPRVHATAGGNQGRQPQSIYCGKTGNYRTRLIDCRSM